MKARTTTIGLILVALFSYTGLGATRNPTGKNPLKNIRANADKGIKVSNRIKQLRANHNSVQGALEAFEKKGHTPKLDEAISITAKIDRSGEVVYRKSNHAGQQGTIIGDGVEVIYITVLSLYDEWQGTIISSFYDANGTLEEQYVADVVITRSPYSPSEWITRFELKFESDGSGYLNHRPGMFTDFNLGTPIQQQTAPLSLNTSQFATSEQMDAYYNLYPEQNLIDTLVGGGGGGVQPVQQGITHHAAKPQRVGGPPISAWTFYTIVGWRPAARDTGLGCTAAAGGCGLGSALFAGAPFAPCFVTSCAAVAGYAAMTNLRIVRR